MKYFLLFHSERTFNFLDFVQQFVLALILLFFLSGRQEALATSLNDIGCLDKDSVISVVSSGEFEGLVLT